MRNPVERKCVHCGGQYLDDAWRPGRPRAYCGDKCRYAARDARRVRPSRATTWKGKARAAGTR